jgi:hypothetical protein
MAFQKASKKNSKLRMALIGPSGSGKTFTALRVARGLGGRVAVLDTERGSAAKYAGDFDFDAQDLEHFAPKDYVRAIHEAEAAGYDVLIIDSLSHAWIGKGGALEMVDQVTKRTRSNNSFGAWKEVTPEHMAMVDAIIRAKLHVIATMRTKTEYVVQADERGKNAPKKVGTAPVQRDGVEYEFDVVGDLDNAEMVVSKTRCSVLAGAVIKQPGEDLGRTLKAWLTDGAPVEETPPSAPMADPPPVTAKTQASARKVKIQEEPKQNSPEDIGFIKRPAKSPTMRLGPFKGAPLENLDEVTLLAAEALAEKLKLEGNVDAFAKTLDKALEEIRGELAERAMSAAKSAPATVSVGPMAPTKDAELAATLKASIEAGKK